MTYKIKLIIYPVILLFVLSYTNVFAGSASLFISKPVPTKVYVGDRITVTVKVKSAEQSINAVSGAISFSENILRFVSMSTKNNSVIDSWILGEPTIGRNKISFQGIILNPGYIGASGNIFNITFEAKKEGQAKVEYLEGAVLANDGLGTNILDSLSFTTFSVLPGNLTPVLDDKPISYAPSRPVALPVITEYSSSVLSKDSIYVKGKGEPNALTKISFKDVSLKSIGERFIEYLQTKKKRLDDVLVKNDSKGEFQYTSSNNLVAGAYNATPFLVDSDKNTEKPGLGVQLFVSDSKLVRYIIVAINVLGLLIPVVGLIVIIYFIPWYSFLRMRVLKKRIGLEEEKIELSAHELKRQDAKLDEDIVPRPPTSLK